VSRQFLHLHRENLRLVHSTSSWPSSHILLVALSFSGDRILAARCRKSVDVLSFALVLLHV
jgi:hypothetical protein